MTDGLNIRVDDYANALTKLASNRDKSHFGFYKARPKLDPQILAVLYEQDAMTARIVDKVVDDAIADGFTLEGTGDSDFDFSEIESGFEDLDALNELGDAWRWARLHGGGVAIPIVKGAGKLHEPLDLKNVTKIESIQVIESQFVTPTTFNPGLGARAFRQPESYTIHVPFGSANNTERTVHWTRVIRFDGVRVSPHRQIQNNGWGPSVIDRVYTETSQLGEVMGYCRNIMHDLSVMVLHMENFRKQQCGTEKDKAEIEQMLETLRHGIDNLHLMVLDSKDTYQEVTRNIAGIEKLVEKFVDALVRATDMPRTILLGESPGGLNANSESELRSWAKFVATQQRRVLVKPINRILEIMFAIQRNRSKPFLEEWTVNFKPISQPTLKETTEAALKLAQANQINILNNIVSEDEARAQAEGLDLITAIDTPQEREAEAAEREAEAEEMRQLAEAAANAQPPGADENGEAATGS